MQKPYVVVAIAHAMPGKEQEVKQAFMDVIEPSRNESTCLEWRFHQDVNDATQFVLYERWVSKEAHQKQFEKPYILAFIERVGDLLERECDIVYAEEIEI